MLRGRHGRARAVSGWVALLVVVALVASVFSAITLPLLVGLVVDGSRRETRRPHTTARWPRRVLVVALLAGSISSGFVWWVAGPVIDASATDTPVPAAADRGGAALLVLALSGVALAVALLGALLARPHPGGQDAALPPAGRQPLASPA